VCVWWVVDCLVGGGVCGAGEVFFFPPPPLGQLGPPPPQFFALLNTQNPPPPPLFWGISAPDRRGMFCKYEYIIHDYARSSFDLGPNTKFTISVSSSSSFISSRSSPLLSTYSFSVGLFLNLKVSGIIGCRTVDAVIAWQLQQWLLRFR